MFFLIVLDVFIILAEFSEEGHRLCSVENQSLVIANGNFTLNILCRILEVVVLPSGTHQLFCFTS